MFCHFQQFAGSSKRSKKYEVLELSSRPTIMASQSPDVKNPMKSMSNDSRQNSSEKPPIGSGSKRKRVESPSDKVDSRSRAFL